MSATGTVLPLTIAATGAPRSYRCYLLAETGHIQALEVLRCASDGEAEDMAARILGRQLDCAVVELWDIGRMILRLHRGPARSQPAFAEAA